MSKQVNLREASKVNWHATLDDNKEYPGDTNIQLGCLIRIADSMEAIAKNHIQLQKDYDYMKQSRDSYKRQSERSFKSNAGLKGQITKLKKKLTGFK